MTEVRFMAEMITPTDVACPICGEGTLILHVEDDTVEYKGITRAIPSQYKVCTACGSEQADMDDLRVNKRAMQAFKKEVEGLLTGQEVKALREVLGLTQADAARMFGGGPVAFSKYESDDVMQSEAMDKLLRVAAHIPSAVNFLHDLAGLSPVRQIGPWEPVVIERPHRVESVLSEEVLSENGPQPWRDVG